MAVVREVYDSDNSEDMFRMELERALEVRNAQGPTISQKTVASTNSGIPGIEANLAACDTAAVSHL